jgi:hypothetical protein
MNRQRLYFWSAVFWCAIALCFAIVLVNLAAGAGL